MGGAGEGDEGIGFHRHIGIQQQQAVLANAPHVVAGGILKRDGGGVAIAGGREDGHCHYGGPSVKRLPTKFGQGLGPVPVLIREIALAMVELQRQIAGGFARDGGNGRFHPGGQAGELQLAPHFRAVHIHDAGGRPHPVIFGHIGQLLLRTVGGGDLPFHAGEVESPLLSVGGRTGMPGIAAEYRPGEGDFDGPTVILIGRIIKRALNRHAGFQAGNVPFIVRGAMVEIGFIQPQIPARVAGIELELVVIMGAARRIHEHFKIGVTKDHAIVIGEGGPDVGFFELGGDVEVVVIPEQLGAGMKTGSRFGGADDVHEVGGPRHLRPGGVIQSAIHGDGVGGVVAQIALRHDGLHPVAPLGGFAGGGGNSGQRDDGGQQGQC